MAYHKWDEKYYEMQYEETMKKLNSSHLKIYELQKELQCVKDQTDFVNEICRPVLFIEEGSLLNLDDQITNLFQFRVVWIKKGFQPPQIYEPKNTKSK